MKRDQLINILITKFGFTKYLEIGCFKGKTFFKIKADKKYAVDPYFHPEFYLLWMKNWIKNPGAIKFFRKTSDGFFENKKEWLEKQTPIEIAFIDGLHTFRASLQDVLNTLKYLDEKGVIVIHDCYPPNAASATPSEHFPSPMEAEKIEGWTGAWCGDVWKTMAYLKSNFGDQLKLWVLDTDNGLGIVRPKRSGAFRNLKINEKEWDSLNNISYVEMKSKAKEMINLVSVENLDGIISGLYEENRLNG